MSQFFHQRRVGDDTIIETAAYRARISLGPSPQVEIAREGLALLRLPMVAGLARPDADERLDAIQVQVPSITTTSMTYVFTATSSLWAQRQFFWRFEEQQILFWHTAEGHGPLGRCAFFSNGQPTPWGSSNAYGPGGNAQILARRCFSPRINHANQLYHDIATPQSLGILSESEIGRAVERDPGALFLPEHYTRLFCPPPLALAFGEGATWAVVGIGTQPGGYQFNGFEYSGARYSGAAFFVDYHGYQSLAGRFSSPKAAIQFGYSEHEALAQHIAWVDASRFGTAPRFPSALWHRAPIVCGWAEQSALATLHGGRAADYATQAYYEEWIVQWEAYGLPFGTIVIDDKWQRGYGTFDVDTDKWPDMPGFIARQHAQGRRVLLWVPGHHREGLDPALCVYYEGKPVTGDVSNPAYEAFLRQQIRHLMLEVGADGFKEDWIGGLAPVAGLVMHAPLYGIEFLRRFQFILHDEAHACKPDALVETQTPHPLFRESSDMLRLNDLWFGTRDVSAVMRARARIARIAGWQILDCDNASSTNLREWWDYMQAQPSIGVPSLYLTTMMESTFERPSPEQWAYLAQLWRQYRHEQGLA